ncbi:MAG: alpha-galactosidase [Meiothermus sp.]|uniref:glycoside hydrolase family 36 protein n=1 Tax=Meiothermus sp. TaxID=1955249 RepID=UPI0025D3EA62|nr:glycoside hydrolase family 36 protein [Meiothermus sp.]MCS7067637.1 alpha-galactosidase [Meiothermus sp.]MDW8425488.1 alpha-galactosidase [Meiothermus sp.]
MQIQGYEFNISGGRLEETLGGYLLHGKQVQIGHPFGRTMFFKHGWQSWSEAAWVSLKENPRPILPPERRPQCDDPAYALSPVHGGSGLGGVEGFDGRMLFLGALRPGARVEADRLNLKGHAEHETTWFLAYGSFAEVLSRYGELLANTLGVRHPQPAPRVWCSWYSYYSDISESQLLQTIAGLQGLPFEVFQVDDGWQQNMGDWEPNHKFPSGMSAIALRAQSQGLTPGLWLAPFIARPSSSLFKEHPDWFLRDEQGELVSAGTNWGGFYALDVTLPAVQDWLRSLIQTVRGWGYRYLKLDFLYAAALPGKRSGGASREEAYREALRILREAAGEDVYILACGAPIIASLGLVDGLRIGPDVAPYWDNEDRRVFLHDPTGPSAYNALRTSLHRLWLRPLVHTDPDVAYFRTRYNLLTPAQRAVLQDLALVSGFKATSDPPEWLDGEEREQLREWLEATPPITQTGPYAFKIGEREVDFSSWL